MSVLAWIGLGSNLADPQQQLLRALDGLAAAPGLALRAVSRFYANPPMGPAEQPDYVNAVAAFHCTLAPLGLLDLTQAIECQQGRVREGDRWGPRTLDLDILLYGESRIEGSRLSVPHPGLAQRAFVLGPMLEAAGQLGLNDPDIPGHGRLSDLLAVCPGLDQLRPL